MTRTIADRVLDAQVEYLAAEGDLYDALAARYDATRGDDYEVTVDYYDRSIELYLPGCADLEPERDFALSLGFARCWVHPHTAAERWKDGPICPCPCKAATQ